MRKDPNANFTDNWIIAANQNLIKLVRNEMDSYKLYNVVRPTLDFIEDLTNWYVRLNRPRMKGDDNTTEDQFNALNTLFDVLLNATTLMSPITPFLSEFIFQNMKNGLADDSPLKQDSIHFTQMPAFDPELINTEIEETVKKMQNAIETGRLVRDTNKISMKYPLSRVCLVNADKKTLEDYKQLSKYIAEELNCLDIELIENEDDYVVYKAEGENRSMGKAFGKKFDKKVKQAIMELPSDKVREYLKHGKVEVCGLEVVTGMLVISKHFKEEYTKSKQWAVASNMKSSVMLDIVQTEELKHIGIAREVTNRIQRLRKSSGISIDDQIEIFYEFKKESKEGLSYVISKYTDKIMAQTRMPVLNLNEKQGSPVLIGEVDYVHPEDEADQVFIKIYLAAPKFTGAFESQFAAQGNDFSKILASYVAQFDRATLAEKVRKEGGLSVQLNEVKCDLKHKEHFFLDARDMLQNRK